MTNDLTTSCEADQFREVFPDRYFSLGMAEQNLVGVMAGLAREGLVPFYPTFAVFGTRRPFEQVAIAVAYPGLRVRIVGFVSGLTTPGGVTHQATDDLALMSLLPNMTVLEVGDATEAESVWSAFDDVEGPIYCRMLRGDVPRLYESPFVFGVPRELAIGNDIVVVSAGVTTQIAAAAVESARSAGISAGHIHISTHKPFATDFVRDRIEKARLGVITVENHSVTGGLGTSVAQIVSESELGRRLIRIGVTDTFAHGGTTPYLFQHYGITTPAVLAAISTLAGISVSLSDGVAQPHAGDSAVV